MKQFTSSSLVEHYWANSISFSKAFIPTQNDSNNFLSRSIEPLASISFVFIRSSRLDSSRQPEYINLFTFVRVNSPKNPFYFLLFLNHRRRTWNPMINRISNSTISIDAMYRLHGSHLFNLDVCFVSLTHVFFLSRFSLFVIEAINRFDTFLT